MHYNNLQRSCEEDDDDAAVMPKKKQSKKKKKKKERKKERKIRQTKPLETSSFFLLPHRLLRLAMHGSNLMK